MFDIGFGELALVFVIGLVVLGPERLPVAVRTVVGWVRALRSLASTVQNELSQELKLQELQDSLKKVEQASKDNLSPELKASMEELREAADSMKKSFHSKMVPDSETTPQTIHNPLITDPEAIHDGVTPAEGATQADAPPMAPAATPGPMTAEAPTTPKPAQAEAPTMSQPAQAEAPTTSRPAQAEAPPATPTPANNGPFPHDATLLRHGQAPAPDSAAAPTPLKNNDRE
ncbi:Sec-independent protein translocase protein TatB [Sodalis sp. RH19]|uniref:Sec-independent protein translocase protein TatB n=1 Tax=unclassified Sodalis (in: enterobacteria) TaxID=2636512 RepID=UPI0039B54472